MPVPEKALKRIRKLAIAAIKENAEARMLPDMREQLRHETGELQDSLRIESATSGEEPILQVIVGDKVADYADDLEISIGVFDDRSKLGARYVEFGEKMVQ